MARSKLQLASLLGLALCSGALPLAHRQVLHSEAPPGTLDDLRNYAAFGTYKKETQQGVLPDAAMANAMVDTTAELRERERTKTAGRDELKAMIASLALGGWMYERSWSKMANAFMETDHEVQLASILHSYWLSYFKARSAGANHTGAAQRAFAFVSDEVPAAPGVKNVLFTLINQSKRRKATLDIEAKEAEHGVGEQENLEDDTSGVLQDKKVDGEEAAVPVGKRAGNGNDDGAIIVKEATRHKDTTGQKEEPPSDYYKRLLKEAHEGHGQ